MSETTLIQRVIRSVAAIVICVSAFSGCTQSDDRVRLSDERSSSPTDSQRQVQDRADARDGKAEDVKAQPTSVLIPDSIRLLGTYSRNNYSALYGKEAIRCSTNETCVISLVVDSPKDFEAEASLRVGVETRHDSLFVHHVAEKFSVNKRVEEDRTTETVSLRSPSKEEYSVLNSDFSIGLQKLVSIIDTSVFRVHTDTTGHDRVYWLDAERENIFFRHVRSPSGRLDERYFHRRETR